MRKPVFALATMLGLLVSAGAHADVSLTFGSNLPLDIVGDGTRAVINFGSAGSGTDIIINSGGNAVGATGTFTGTFEFLKAAITDVDAFTQTAALASNSPVRLSLTDQFGGIFTADVGNSSITSFGGGIVNVINPNMVVNLTNMLYVPGDNASVLSTLAAQDNGLITFNFDSDIMDLKNLDDLVDASSTLTGYSGSIGGFDSITSVPEPGPIVLTALSTLPLMGVYLRRRRNAA